MKVFKTGLAMKCVDWGVTNMLEAYTLGDVFIFLAAATWAVCTVCGARTIRRVGSTVFTT